jgi:hypothetical protein
VLVAALLVGLAGCGGDSSTKTRTPTVSLSGAAIQGAMSGSTVSAYAVNAGDGSSITPALATTTTDSGGQFDLAIPPQSGPVRITVSGGSFESEMNGAAVGAPGTVSLLMASGGANVSGLSVNPLSTFVDSRTVGLLAAGGMTFGAALSQAAAQIEKIYGLSSDPGSLTPNYRSSGTDAANLGLIVGAIINEDQYLCPSAPGGLVTALAADIADGVFDGKGPGGAAISYCGGELPAVAGIIDFQDALSGLNQLQDVTGAFAFGGSGNILTANGLANVALGGTIAYPVAPLATIDSAIPQAAPAPVDSFAASGGPSMTTARANATATLLPDGEVLIAGGFNFTSGDLSSAELYDPATGKFTATSNSMTTGRYGATATLLPNGEVLIAGGATSVVPVPIPTSSADLYDPSTGKFAATSNSMTVARYFATATLLPNGEVLIAGGFNSTSGVLSSAELYDPASGKFTATSNSMTTVRYGATATLLPNGEVLIAGGAYFLVGGLPPIPTSSADLYDPATGKFTATGSMTTAREFATATLLPNGEVLIAGGDTDSGATSSAELYDPATGKFTATSNSMTTAGAAATATLLPNGEVLIAGGQISDTSPTKSAELYDPATGKFTATSNSMTTGRAAATATLLPNGEVLIAGGQISDAGAITNSTDLYTP